MRARCSQHTFINRFRMLPLVLLLLLLLLQLKNIFIRIKAKLLTSRVSLIASQRFHHYHCISVSPFSPSRCHSLQFLSFCSGGRVYYLCACALCAPCFVAVSFICRGIFILYFFRFFPRSLRPHQNFVRALRAMIPNFFGNFNIPKNIQR